jgi:hypothetical protein
MMVEFRDADTDGWIHEQDLSFDPRLSPVIELKRKFNDFSGRAYQVMRDRGRMKIAADKPDQASLVVYLKEIRSS